MSEITNYKEKLEDELDTLTKELKSLGIQNPRNKEDWIATPDDVGMGGADPNVVGDRSENWQEKRGTLDALETRYNNIKRAFGKMEAGEFGKCEVCGAVIEEDRLEANPAARTCKAHIEEEAKLPIT